MKTSAMTTNPSLKICSVLLLLVASHYTFAQDPCAFSSGSYAPLKGFVIAPGIINEFSYVLAKGMHYQLSACIEEGSGAGELDITVSNSKRKLIIDNRGKPYGPFGFTCKKSGIYYITSSCRTCQHSLTTILSFSRKEKKPQTR